MVRRVTQTRRHTVYPSERFSLDKFTQAFERKESTQMANMIVEAKMKDLMFIHGQRRDNVQFRLMNADRLTFDHELPLNLEKFNFVQLGLLLA